MTRIMFIEYFGGLGCNRGIIGRVHFSKSGKTLYYRNWEFRSLKGYGYKTNYYEVDSMIECWLSGPRKDGNDGLYPLVVDIDEDVREEYWLEIRNRPDLIDKTSYRCKGKYTRRMPRPSLCVSGHTRVGSDRGGMRVKKVRTKVSR